MMQGLVKAFGGSIDLEEALSCIADEITAVRNFELFFKLAQRAVKDRNVKETLPALLAAISGFKEAKKGFGECNRIEKTTWNFESMNSAVDFYAQPRMMLAKANTSNIEFDSKAFYLVAMAASKYEDGQFAQAGEILGKALQIIMKESGPYNAAQESTELKQLEALGAMDYIKIV